MLRLFHKDELIGLIENPIPDELATVGDIKLTQAAESLHDVLEFFNDDQKRWQDDPPFPAELLEHWFIEDETGNRTEIDVPIINDKGEIWWR